MARIEQSPGLQQPFSDVFPSPIVSDRDPTSNDKRYPLGQVWVNKSSQTFYGLSAVSAGSATWVLLASGGTDLETLSGDSGTATPSDGDIEIAGGANITTSATGSTVTAALDATVSGLTSVSSTSYSTSSATTGATWSANIITADGSNSDITFFILPKGSGTVAHSRELIGDTIFVNAVNSDDTDPASGAGFTAQVGGTSAGDAKSIYRINAGTAYSLGLDNSTTNDDFVISQNANLGTSNLVSFDGSTFDATFAAAVTLDTGNLTVTAGDLNLDTAGSKINISTGADASVGTSGAMTAGSVTVNTTAVTSNSLIFVQPATLGTVTAPQAGYVSAISDGVSFTITSADNTDTSTWNWWLIN